MKGEPMPTFEKQPEAQKCSARVEIFDPPLCCPTGLCGPTIDPLLLDVHEMVLKLQAQGMQVCRYQLSSHPQAFMANPQVFQLIRERQLTALPITVVNGQVIKIRAYPTLDEVQKMLREGN